MHQTPNPHQPSTSQPPCDVGIMNASQMGNMWPSWYVNPRPGDFICIFLPTDHMDLFKMHPSMYQFPILFSFQVLVMCHIKELLLLWN